MIADGPWQSAANYSQTSYSQTSNCFDDIRSPCTSNLWVLGLGRRLGHSITSERKVLGRISLTLVLAARRHSGPIARTVPAQKS